jgi:hypothetical protein
VSADDGPKRPLRNTQFPQGEALEALARTGPRSRWLSWIAPRWSCLTDKARATSSVKGEGHSIASKDHYRSSKPIAYATPLSITEVARYGPKRLLSHAWL